MPRERTRRDLIDRIIELEARIKALETSTRIGVTSVDSGALTVNSGAVVVKGPDGQTNISLTGGTSPALNLFPLGLETSSSIRSMVRSYSSDGANPNPGVKVTTNDINANQSILDLASGFVSLSNEPATASPSQSVKDSLKSKLILGTVGDDTRGIYLQGRWLRTTISRFQAVVIDSVTVSAGFSSMLFTYGFQTPPGEQMIPIVTLTGSTATSWAITSQDNNGFQVSWGDTTARGINVWAVRTLAA